MIIALAELPSTVAPGDSQTLEFKKSTNERHRAGQPLCCFLNTDGGQLLICVTPESRAVGLQVANITLREIALMPGRFDLPRASAWIGSTWAMGRS